MKKLLTIMVVALLAVCYFGLVACGGGVEGTYKFKSMTYEGQTYNIGDVAPWGDDVLTADSNTFELKKDGTAVATSNVAGQVETQNGTWTQDGNTITVSITVEDQTQTVTMTLDGNVLTYNVTEGMTYVYEKA